MNKINSKNKPREIESHSTLENFNTFNDKILSFCKFCSIKGHSMSKCTRYNMIEHKQICNKLDLYEFYSSNRHSSENCYGEHDKLTYPCYNCNKKKSYNCFM